MKEGNVKTIKGIFYIIHLFYSGDRLEIQRKC